MIIQNVKAFGRFVPGDELEIPDGNTFDHAYWREMKEVTETVEREETVTHEVTETVEIPEVVTELEPVEGNN